MRECSDTACQCQDMVLLRSTDTPFRFLAFVMGPVSVAASGLLPMGSKRFGAGPSLARSCAGGPSGTACAASAAFRFPAAERRTCTQGHMNIQPYTVDHKQGAQEVCRIEDTPVSLAVLAIQPLAVQKAVTLAGH